MDDFFRILKDAINMDADDVIGSDTVLADLDGWDSLGKFMLVSSLYSEFGVILEPNCVNGARSVGELWGLVQKSKQ